MVDFIAGLVGLAYFLSISVATKQHFRSEKYPFGMYAISVISLVGITVFLIHAFWNDLSFLVGTFALMIFAQVLFIWAIRHSRGHRLGLAFDEGAQADGVIRTGPWKFMRHPFYASYIVFWLACALGAQHPVSVIVFVTLFGIYVYSARREEGALISGPHHDDYAEYRQSVGFFFPKLQIRN